MLLHVGLGGKRRSPTPVVHSTHPGQTPTPSWNELKTVGWGLTLHTRALPHFLETAEGRQQAGAAGLEVFELLSL